ncbi:hypothetical protein [Bradyrhizobium sp. 141]|uniref:hypothetical protein n=1 Tax=Bradyrhizobium sp. 141 TaxID=2782617 RepID=UPI001FFAD8CA|nr:hypothetical protein [Bradyrhizobium sp. 141]MCK1717208.1 hypothetical protein [Bradyrhizobium sp. 141]
MTSFYETSFEVGRKTVLVFAEYTLTGGCPAHMGSMNYPGHPAEPAELEFVKVEINTKDADHKTAKAENFFPAPDWLVTILHEDDDIYQEICSGHEDDGYDDYYELERD